MLKNMLIKSGFLTDAHNIGQRLKDCLILAKAMCTTTSTRQVSRLRIGLCAPRATSNARRGMSMSLAIFRCAYRRDLAYEMCARNMLHEMGDTVEAKPLKKASRWAQGHAKKPKISEGWLVDYGCHRGYLCAAAAMESSRDIIM